MAPHDRINPPFGLDPRGSSDAGRRIGVAAAAGPRHTLAASTTTAAALPLYFVNWWVDGALIGGLSILAWLAITVFGRSIDTKSVSTIALILSVFINWPHFSATVYRLYQSPQHMRQFPVTAWGLPCILAGAVFACLRLPQTVAPYFLMLYLLWSPYHYSGQTIGLTMIYAKRSGFAIGRRERLALSTFVFSAFVYAVLHLRESGFGSLFGTPVTVPVFPAWLAWGAQAAMCAGGLVFAGFAMAWCRKEQRMLPPIVLLPAAAQFVWFVPAAGHQTFAIIVPVFHSLQYLLIACAVQLKRRLDAAGAERSPRRIRDEALRWGARNIVGGVLLFIGIPVLLLGCVRLPIATVLVVVAAAVNIHHFFVDGVIWKLRDRDNASALTMNITALARTPAIALDLPVSLPA